MPDTRKYNLTLWEFSDDCPKLAGYHATDLVEVKKVFKINLLFAGIEILYIVLPLLLHYLQKPNTTLCM